MDSFKIFYEGAKRTVVTKRKKKLNVEDVTLSLIDNNQLDAHIEIMLNRDPNIIGHVKYDDLEKAKMAFKHLTKLGPILNFMYYNMTNNDTAFKWAHIVNIEIQAEKKKSKEEIEKDGINFTIKSDMEREAEMQAKMMGAEMGEEPTGEVPPQLQKTNERDVLI
jgi:hypothetical protein